jgi:hypothetical protein
LLRLPLAAHALASAFGADCARKVFGWFSFWASMAIAATVGACAAAIMIAPPVTSDGHPVMPIGQVVIASILGPLVGIALAYGFAKKVAGAAKSRHRVLHGLLAVLLVIAITRGAREWRQALNQGRLWAVTASYHLSASSLDPAGSG